MLVASGYYDPATPLPLPVSRFITLVPEEEYRQFHQHGRIEWTTTT
jgi:hypothetical protein